MIVLLSCSFKLPDHLHLANLPEIEQADKELKASGKGDNLSQMGEWHDGSLTWDFVAWIRAQTSLPIFVKVLISSQSQRLCLLCVWQTQVKHASLISLRLDFNEAIEYKE